MSTYHKRCLAKKEEERNQLKSRLVSISIRLHEAVVESAAREKEITTLHQAKSAYQIKLCELNEEITQMRNTLSPLMNKSIAMNRTPGMSLGLKSFVDFSMFKDEGNWDESICDADFFDALFITPKKQTLSPPKLSINVLESPPTDFQLTDLLPMGSKVEHMEGAQRRRSSLTKSSVVKSESFEKSDPNDIENQQSNIFQHFEDNKENEENRAFDDSVKLKLQPLGEIARRKSLNNLSLRGRMRKVSKLSIITIIAFSSLSFVL